MNDDNDLATNDLTPEQEGGVRRPLDNAVWMRARAELRHGRWSAALMALFVAIAGAAVLIGVASARRTDGAYDQMVAATEAWDVLINPDAGSNSALRVEAVSKLPQVSDAARLEGVFIGPARIDDLSEVDQGPGGMVGLDGALQRFSRPIVVSGRLARPDRFDQVTISDGLATSQHLEPGDVLPAKLLRPADFEAIEAAGSGSRGDSVAKYNDPKFGDAVGLTIAGVVRFPDDMVVDKGNEQHWIYVSEAFWERYNHPSAGFGAIIVRLRPGTDIDEFRRSVNALVPDEALVLQTQAANRTKVMRSVRPTVIAILGFAALALTMSLVMIAQAFSRRFRGHAVDNPTLAGLGMTRRQRALASLLWAAAPIAIGSAIAAMITVLASPIAPIGVAQRAEPHNGIHADWPVILLGAPATAVVLLVVVAVPAWLAASTTNVTGRAVPSRLTRSMMAAGAPIPAVLGTRFALETRRGRSDTPTRTVLIGATTGVALVVALLSFGASLQRFTTTPRLYGTPWNLQIDGTASNDEAATALRERTEAMLDQRSDVRQWSALSASGIELEHTSVPAVGLDGGDRPVDAPVIDGRNPSRPDEVALGTSTMDQLGIAVGDTATATDPTGASRELKVVGQVVLPSVGSYPGSDKTSMGYGAVMTGEGLRSIAPDVGNLKLVAVLDHDADVAAVEAQLPQNDDGFAYAAPIVRPAEIDTLQALRSTPLVLVGLVVALVAASVAHAIVVAVRFRRHDLAILRACGFVRNQVIAATVMQALTSGLVAITFGVPIGLLAGIASWNALAAHLGTLPEPVVPIAAVGIACAGVLGVTVLMGLLPGLSAAKRSSATALRVA